MSWINRVSQAVDYEGDIAVAANEVLAELDDTDGLQVGTKAFRALIRAKAREHRVLYKDLTTRVLELV